MSKHLVLSVKPYDFLNKDGERISGAKVAYINKKPSSRETEIGHPPMIVSVNAEMASKLVEVPGVYDLEFEQVTGKNNKPEIVLADLELLQPVELNNLF